MSDFQINVEQPNGIGKENAEINSEVADGTTPKTNIEVSIGTIENLKSGVQIQDFGEIDNPKKT